MATKQRSARGSTEPRTTGQKSFSPQERHLRALRAYVQKNGETNLQFEDRDGVVHRGYIGYVKNTDAPMTYCENQGGTVKTRYAAVELDPAPDAAVTCVACLGTEKP